MNSSIANGSTLAGPVTWEVTPSSSVSKVEFYIDGALRWTENAAPYAFNGDGNQLDTKTLSNGGHVLKVVATATDGTKAEVSSTVTVANGAPPTPPSAPAVVNVKVSYGTSDSAIRQAISAAQSSGRALYFPAGRYTYTSNLVVSGLTVYGDGATTVLTATNPQASAIVMQGTGGVIRDLEIVSPNATSRSSTGAAAGIQVYHAVQFTIQNVIVDGTAETGIIVRGGVNGMIRGNTVQNTLADAIHMTLGSHDITVSGNVVRNPGDDMIAVVSYLSQGTPCRNITISDNDVQGQTWGRGISTVGGENVTISGNTIGQTYGAGVYVAAEDDPYFTFGTLNVKVLDNNITGTDLGRIGHGAVQLNGQSGHLVDGTLVSGNVIRQSHYGINVEHDVVGTIIGTNDIELT